LFLSARQDKLFRNIDSHTSETTLKKTKPLLLGKLFKVQPNKSNIMSNL